MDTTHNNSLSLRDALNNALNDIIHLENGVPMSCAPVTDPDQRKQLESARKNILKALTIEGACAAAP